MFFNAKNIVEAEGIRTFVKNEYSQGIVGDLSPQAAWPELWVCDDNEAGKALALLQGIKVGSGPAWNCSSCGAQND